MSTIPENTKLLKVLFELLQAHRPIIKQERIYQRLQALLMAELFVFTRHTLTQQLMALGQTEADWSAWYRLFSEQRFDYDKASEILFSESLKHVSEEELYVVAGDGTQTPRSSGKIEGSGWLRNPRTPAFMIGIHHAQRWFNGSWLMPPENGYSRALPLRWLPAFTEKSKPKVYAPQKEWEAAIAFLKWLLEQLKSHHRPQQQVLMVGDGSYDTLNMWKHLPEGVILLARSAKNRALYRLVPENGHGNRKYGDRMPTPQDLWRKRTRWRKTTLEVRGKTRHLQYRIYGPVVRHGAPDTPLFLIIVRGKQVRLKKRTYYREPLPFLVNAILNEDGDWVLPLPIEILLFWAWQRWEIEVCHREIKSNLGLGNKQCWNPHAAVLSVQWTAWVYSLLLLVGYQVWGLSNAPPVPTRWWQGAPRWSLNTLLRAFRAAFWGQHHFLSLCSPNTPNNWAEKEQLLNALQNSIFAAARS